MIRTYKPSQIADGILAEEFFRDTEFVLASEVERLARERDEARAEVEKLRKALYRIAGKVPFADDPWSIARKALEAKP